MDVREKTCAAAYSALSPLSLTVRERSRGSLGTLGTVPGGVCTGVLVYAALCAEAAQCTAGSDSAG